MPDDDFIEFASDEVNSDMPDYTPPEEEVDAPPVTPPPTKNITKEGKIRKAILISALILLTLVGIHKIIWTVLERDMAQSKKTAQEEEIFTLNKEDAIAVTKSFLSGDHSTIVQRESNTAALALFKQRFSSPAETSVKKDPEITLDSYPNHYSVLTDASDPIYVIQNGNRHAIDLEATVGYNTAKSTDFTATTDQRASYIRITFNDLIPEKSDRYYGCVSVTFPNEEKSLDLYYERYTNTGKNIEAVVKRNRSKRMTVEISPYNPDDTPRYFISKIHKRGWIFKVREEIDMEAFDALNY